MISYLNFSELNDSLLDQYRSAMSLSYPKFLYQSKVVKNYWPLLEQFFPTFQLFMTDGKDELLGYINTLPFHYNQSLKNLPDEGWDWLIQKGINDHKNKIKPNTLGGLQIGVTKNNLGKGFSKLLISKGKEIKDNWGFNNLVIPIRPTFKSLHPEIMMSDYINKKEDDKIFDPWIRTHLNCGARIIKVCSNAMNVTGNIDFWRTYINQKIMDSGSYNIEGALNPIEIQVEKNLGEYREENVWICYEW